MATPSVSSRAARRIAGAQLPAYLFDSHGELARHVAQSIAHVIRERNAVGQNAVLSLSAGSFAVGVYRELARLHDQEGLDFSRVVVFGLGEYYGLGGDRLQSLSRWLRTNFCGPVGLPPENIHTLDGGVHPDDVEEHCRRFEDAMERAGGVDVQVLSLGRNGHVGFNEPFCDRHSRTRLAALDLYTRKDASSSFFTEENVPTQALTQGLGTILEARKIFVVALGEDRAGIVREAVEGPRTERVPASFLREHAAAALLVDSGAASDLTGFATPWVLGKVRWSDALVKRAVLWLVEKTGKSLLKLDDADFRDHDLHELLREHGPAHEIAHRVFRWMMETINYHPAGRDRQRVICFSPHPDDDVISMGGTLIRLVEDGHETHIAYMTSGNIAVFDHDAARLADLVAEFNRLFGIDHQKSIEVERQVVDALAAKGPGDPDSEAVLRIKGLIRWSEAKAGAKVAGCKEEHLHFLDLPFYRTGRIAKKAISEEDVAIIRNLICEVQPAQVYVAGDLSDPHGTHRVCAEAIFRALLSLPEGAPRPEVLLYRGAWAEWEPHEIEIAVPLSPRDIERKKAAIFRHESQKDTALFPGPDDPREFWQRAVERNRGTADVYNRIGLPEYFALEGFVRWDGRSL